MIDRQSASQPIAGRHFTGGDACHLPKMVIDPFRCNEVATILHGEPYKQIRAVVRDVA